MKVPHTQLENATLEALVGSPFSSRELRIILAILRVTNGYHLNQNRVGVKYLADLTHIDRRNVWDTLQKLDLKQVIERDKSGFVSINGPALWNTVPVEKAQEGTATPSLATLETKTPDPRVTQVRDALQLERGYVSPNCGGEAKASKWMLRQGHTCEDILDCYRALKRDPWWGGRELFLMSVQKEIQQWSKAGKLPDWFEKGRRHESRRDYSKGMDPAEIKKGEFRHVYQY